MYCVNCGVRLADGESVCPLCETVVYHPDLPTTVASPLYPEKKYPKASSPSKLAAVLLTVMFVLAATTVLLCDIRVSGGISWSGYVVGALLVAYVSIVLPRWFAAPNPVVFVPCAFAAAGVYVLYIDLAVGGRWFLSFAFPVICMLGVTVTAVTTLFRYLKKGRLYILGGAVSLVGVCMLPLEFLANYTFGVEKFNGWSLYPLSTLVVIGAFLIFLAIYRPAREAMERIFFI